MIIYTARRTNYTLYWFFQNVLRILTTKQVYQKSDREQTRNQETVKPVLRKRYIILARTKIF